MFLVSRQYSHAAPCLSVADICRGCPLVDDTYFQDKVDLVAYRGMVQGLAGERSSNQFQLQNEGEGLGGHLYIATTARR